jgi:hypothetical protein
MKITLISFDNWGFNQHIVNSLLENNHEVNHIDFSKFKYKYPNFFFKIYNFILKLFFKQNLKTKFYGEKIINSLDENPEKQDLILTIKGDFIAPEFAKQIKNYTKKSVAFFNDNINRCPKIIRVIPHFDEVFSFEKKDCEKYNLKFATNWIYNSISMSPEKSIKRQVFNIISEDKRLPVLSKIASDLNAKNISHKILVYSKTGRKKTCSIDYISKKKSLEKIKNYINSSQVLLDINRDNQDGLTFRVFESIGLQKKLITTNTDIKNYDFYNPNNILIIDKINPDIEISFFDKEYQQIPSSIYNKYSLDGWLKKVVFNNLR